MSNTVSHQFTPAEAAAFAELSEKKVRKELEYQVIRSEGDKPRLSFAALVYLHLVRGSELTLPVSVRTALLERIVETLAGSAPYPDIEVARPYYLRLEGEVEALVDKIKRFFAWKATLVSDPDIMGGATVFPDSRLTVRRVGGLLLRGVDPSELLEDYPHLSPLDLECSKLYVQAYPVIGRPSRQDAP